MRKRKISGGITVNAIAGTHVIFFGLDIEPEQRNGFRGFAFKRRDHSTDETIWLRGLKTFAATEPHPAMGEDFSTWEHPVQGFQWADYSAKPGHTYTFTIHRMYGDPTALTSGGEVTLTVETEKEFGETHSVFFNRGSVATQEYARRFLNRPPSKAGVGAYEWLSRGLLEALLLFIKRAEAGDAIHAAVYEFQWEAVLLELKAAAGREVTVQVIYDDVEGYDKNGDPEGPWKPNRDAIEKAGIQDLCTGRANAKLMHNKFFVLSKGGQPTAVFTGSTNLTENGIFGHSNIGHVVEDKTVARNFLAYWERLKRDLPIAKTYRDENIVAFTIPGAVAAGTASVFSPRGTNLDSLDWYAKIAASAREALFMTFAFGMHEKFKQVYREESEVLKMALMEKAFASPNVKERDETDIAAIRKRRNVVVALGNRIVTNSFDRWLKEMASVDSKRKHIYWVHTKYMLVDPLGAEPVVISGSANFSKASSDTNDENMLVIRGDKRIADIYFGEYIRLYAHYSFREAVKRYLEREAVDGMKQWKPQFLETEDTWMKDYFNDQDDNTARCLRRIYFSGPLSV